MDTSPYEALAEAAVEGVDFDGLVVEREDGQLSAETPETTLTAPVETPRSALRDVSEYVTNWFFFHQHAPQADDRWAFLRWLEGAEREDTERVTDRYDALESGRSRSWGQLSITVTLGEAGRRRYDLRHEDDDGTDPEDLRALGDPRAARELAKEDPRGRYRPLKAAPTLQDGWVYHGVDAETLLAAVEYFYPATVANWYRERQGNLDVTHWRETMARQTGIYGVIQTWDRQDGHEHVDWVAEACCDDSQCLKRREWQYDEETTIDTDGGDGEFPCREPCSVVVSAARQWTKLEGEQARTYEFELTPSEKEQVEAIVDAVAEGRVGDIREADVYDSANRFRTRFLRAKRFDENDDLCGVPTDGE